MPSSSTPEPAAVETSHSIDSEGRDGTPMPAEWDHTSAVRAEHLVDDGRLWPATNPLTGQPADITIRRDGDQVVLTAPADVTVRDMVDAMRALLASGSRLAEDLEVRFTLLDSAPGR